MADRSAAPLLFAPKRWYVRQPVLTRALLQFAFVSLVLTLFFWVVRIGIMTDVDYARKRFDRVEHPVWDAFYQSVMTQTTVGASDLSPVSIRAQVLDATQALTTFLAVLVVGLIFAASAPAAKA